MNNLVVNPPTPCRIGKRPPATETGRPSKSRVVSCFLRTFVGGCTVIPITSGYTSALARRVFVRFLCLTPHPLHIHGNSNASITAPRRDRAAERSRTAVDTPPIFFEPTSRIDEPGACACMQARLASIRPSPCSSSPPAYHFTSCRVLRRGHTAEMGLASPLSSRTHDSSATPRSQSRPTVPPVLMLPSSAPLFS